MGLPMFYMTAALIFSLLLLTNGLIQIPGPRSVSKRQGPSSATLATRHDKAIRETVLIDLLGSVSYPELRSIQKPTLLKYIFRKQRNVQHRLDAKWTWSDAPNLDGLFRGRLGLDRPSHLNGAIKFFVTKVPRLGECSLFRAIHALKGWSLAPPALQRLPRPLEAPVLISGLLMLHQPRDVVIRSFLALISYLQPCESIRQVWQPARPTLSSQCRGLVLNPLESEVPGETTSDVLTLPATSRQPLAPLGSHSHGQFVQALKNAVALLDMGGTSRGHFQKQ